MLATHWSNALWCQIMKHRLFLQKESADGRQIDKFEFRLIITLISLFHYNKAKVVTNATKSSKFYFKIRVK